MSKSYARLSLAPTAVLGFRKDGRAIRPIAGGSVDSVGGATGESNSGGGDSTPSSSAGTGASGSEASSEGGEAKKLAALEEEKNRHYRLRAEAEEREKALAAKLKQIEDKDKSELEKTAGRVTELEATNAKLQEELDDLRLDNAILADSKHNWRDRRAVLKLLDRSEVEFKDGKPQGLDRVLADLAKNSPYLLAEENKEPKDTGANQPSTGKAPASRNGNAPSATREDLAKRYPGLRR